MTDLFPALGIIEVDGDRAWWAKRAKKEALHQEVTAKDSLLQSQAGQAFQSRSEPRSEMRGLEARCRQPYAELQSARWSDPF